MHLATLEKLNAVDFDSTFYHACAWGDELSFLVKLFNSLVANPLATKLNILHYVTDYNTPYYLPRIKKLLHPRPPYLASRKTCLIIICHRPRISIWTKRHGTILQTALASCHEEKSCTF